MELIDTIEYYDDLIREKKESFGKLRSNVFSQKEHLKKYLVLGRLYVENYPDGLFFFLDEENYYRAFYFWSRERIMFTRYDYDKPVLLEEPDMNGLRKTEIYQIGTDLQRCGFCFHKTNSRYEMDLKGVSPEENKAFIDEICKKEQLRLTYCTEERQKRGVLKLWDESLDFVDIPWDRRLFQNKGESVACLINEAGDVVSTYRWELIGKNRCEGHHLVTQENYRQKGLARVLYREWQNNAIACGTNVLTSWIDDKNDASIRLHEDLGFHKTGKVCAQYLLG